MRYVAKMARHWAAGPLLVTALLGVAMLVATRSVAGDENEHGILARGAGTTMIHGGTGSSGGFVPVLTTLVFHAERSAGGVTGTFDCLALAPEATTGKGSGQFTVNAMYVVGRITGATVSGDTATLTGTSSITGLGAGTNVAFTFVVRRGGPGATAVLTVSTLPASPFHEVLVQGSFEVQDQL
jgi:hypothetical protein